MRQEQRVNRYDSLRFREKAFKLYVQAWPPKAIHLALQQEFGESAPARSTVSGWCGEWTRAKNRNKKGYTVRLTANGFRSLDVQVYDRAFEIYSTETESPKSIREKLIAQFNGRTPKIMTIYQWRLRWRRAAARARGEAPVDLRFKNARKLGSAAGSTKMMASRPLHTGSEQPLVCRRSGLPYILEENCVAWQEFWSRAGLDSFESERALRPCRECGSHLTDTPRGKCIAP